MSDLDDYELGAVLGAGALARVHAGHRRADGRPVAVKVIHDPADPVARRRLHREAEVLEAVDHPAVLRFLAVVDDRHVALVTDLVPGGDLTRRLARAGALPPSAVVELLLDLTAGVEALHRRGFVHRDICPSNVLLDARGRPVLADLASATPVGTSDATTSGTPVYLDPAVADGLAADERTDVYAVGALAYELLTGAPPLTGPAPLAVRHAASTGACACLDEAGIDVDLAAIVHRALHRIPHRRFPHAGALRAELERWSGSERAAAAAPLDEPSDELVSGPRRRPAGRPSQEEGPGHARPVAVPSMPETTLRDWIGADNPSREGQDDGEAASSSAPALEFGSGPPPSRSRGEPARRPGRTPVVAAVIAAALVIAPLVMAAVLRAPTEPAAEGVASAPVATETSGAPTAAPFTRGAGAPAEDAELTAPEAADCPTVEPAPPGALRGDVTGDGCDEVVRFADGVLSLPEAAGGGRFAVGEPGDVALLGDFACTGVAQLAIYRPEVGVLWHFPGWPPDGQALESGPPLSVGHGEAEVVDDGPCMAVRIRPTAEADRGSSG